MKRKAAELLETDDFENLDPILFAKRSKGGMGSFFPKKDGVKSSIILTTVPAGSPSIHSEAACSPLASGPRPRTIIKPKSQTAKANAGSSNPSLANLSSANSFPASPASKSLLSSSLAGRSPTRTPQSSTPYSKRSGAGIMASRRGARQQLGGTFSPSFSLGAALAGTGPTSRGGTYSSFSRHHARTPSNLSTSSTISSSDSILGSSLLGSSLNFTIHEDTAEQEMTNLLQHSTCTLDISSDEESALRAKRDRAEGRDKENIPPPDDVSQTSGTTTSRSTTSNAAAARAAALSAEKTVASDENVMDVNVVRTAMAELPVEDYYAPGCGADSVVFVEGDEEEVDDELAGLDAKLAASSEDEGNAPGGVFTFEPEIGSTGFGEFGFGANCLSAAAETTAAFGAEEQDESDSSDDISQVALDELMLPPGNSDNNGKAAVLQPIEGTGENFDLWESGSAKDEAEAGPPPASP